MAEERDDIILDLSIDQGDLVKQLNQAKKAIIETREEQAKLRKEYIAGTKTIDEYAEESVKLEKQLKDENDSYKNLTKAIQANSGSLEGQRAKLAVLTRERNKLDKSNKDTAKEFDRLTKEIKDLNDEIGKHEQAGGDFRRNVGNYKNAIVEASEEINVGGQSVSGLTASLSKFANPATAAVGIVTLLTASYANSTAGARDLANAQNQLAAATNIVNNRFAALLGITGRGGKGIFATITSGVLQQILGAEISSISSLIANEEERLQDLEVSLVRAQGFAKDAEKRAEDARRIRDDAEADLQDRLRQTQEIEDQLAVSAGIRESVLQTRLNILKSVAALQGTVDDPQVQIEIANVEREILDIQEEVNGKLTENVTARREIIKLVQEQADFERQEALNAGAPGVDLGAARPEGGVLVDQARIDAELQLSIQEKLNRDILKLREDQYIEDVKSKRAADEQKREIERQTLAVTAGVLAQGAALFEEQSAANKLLSSFNAIISTYEAANVALASAPPPANFFLAALTTAIGLANVAKINGVGFASGGYTGPGHNTQPAGIVHKNEVVWNAQDVAAVGGPSVANMMRPTHRSRNSRGRGYQDGGIVTAAATRDTNQQLITANLMKNMPAPVVGVKEFARVQRRVQVKENITRS